MPTCDQPMYSLNTRIVVMKREPTEAATKHCRGSCNGLKVTAEMGRPIARKKPTVTAERRSAKPVTGNVAQSKRNAFCRRGKGVTLLVGSVTYIDDVV